MKHTAKFISAARPFIGRAFCCSVLTLAITGCHEQHIATTQVVVDLGNNQTAVVEVPMTQPSAAPAEPMAGAPAPVMTTEPSTMPMSTDATAPTTMAAPAEVPAPTPMPMPASMPATQQSSTDETTAPTTQNATNTDNINGSGAADMSGSAGHNAAQGSRSTFSAMAGGATAFGSSVVDIATNSARRLKNTPPESLSAPVIDVDEAMQARDWDQSTATYKSGGTVAGPIGFLYEPRPGQSGWRYNYVEIPLFLGNTALLPLAFAKTPPWAPVYWKAATIEPTYTAVPPLPPQ